MSPGKFAPDAYGPEFRARWADRSGYWRLSVYRRDGHEADSVYTDTPSADPQPSDKWLGKLGFAPVGDSDWAADEDGGWQRAVEPAAS